MSYLPLFHIYGFSEISMMCVLTGARQVLMDVFDADRALDLAEREGATVLHGFEAHWLDLLNAQARKARTLPSGSVPCRPASRARSRSPSACRTCSVPPCPASA